jgi:hypothetical protein
MPTGKSSKGGIMLRFYSSRVLSFLPNVVFLTGHWTTLTQQQVHPSRPRLVLTQPTRMFAFVFVPGRDYYVVPLVDFCVYCLSGCVFVFSTEPERLRHNNSHAIMANNGHNSQYMMLASLYMCWGVGHLEFVFYSGVCHLWCCIFCVFRFGHNMVDTTTFAVIMTTNGHDQQQTMSVCFLYVTG